jgi:putative ABC transport system permease protein
MQLTALRSTARLLLRQKSFSLINILGLAIGLSACLLLYLYVQFELSYDAYNDKAARIARVTSILHSPETDIAVAGTPAALAPVLLRDCPEIEAAARLESANLTIRQGGEMVAASDFYFSDQAIFSVFSFSFLDGSAKAALATPNSIVLTRSAATFYLGPGPAIGRTLLLNGTPYRVTAVMKNRP